MSGADRQAAVLIERLSALRRRAILVRALSVGLASALVAVAAAEIAALSLGLDGRATFALVAATAAAAVTGAVLVVLWRAPALAQIASVVDRRQRLQTCAVTALQFAADDDAVARLVVRDASARLQACAPADVFPFQYPSRLPWLVAGVTVTSVLLGAGLTRDAARVPASGSGGETGAGAAASRPGGAVRVAPNEPAASAAATSAEKPAPSASAPTPAPAAAPNTDNAPAPPQSASSPAAASLDSDAGRTSVSAPQRERTVAAAALPRSSEGAAVRAAGAEGLPAGGATGSRAGGPGGGGAGLGEETGRTRTGGGVEGGSIEAGSGVAAPRALTAAEAARYRIRWDRAQAAAARDRVPPALRSYVRDYFAAIRTPGPR